MVICRWMCVWICFLCLDLVVVGCLFGGCWFGAAVWGLFIGVCDFRFVGVLIAVWLLGDGCSLVLGLLGFGVAGVLLVWVF